MRISHREGPHPPTGPRADCTADTAGGLTFDVEPPGGAERWDAALLLHPEGPDTAHRDPVRLPLSPSGGGRLRASLPSTMTLAEGRWAAYLALGDEPPSRLRSGRHDLSSLVGREPSLHRTWLGVRIPYATGQDGLALRSWLRWPHAEAGELHFTDTALTLHGRLYGAEPGGDARLEARRRGTADRNGSVSARVTRDGGGFRCTLRFATLPTAGDWDLWLRLPGPTGPVRVARILDDVPEKHRDLTYRPLRTPSGLVTPYWTGDNDLAVRLDAPGGAVGRPAGDSTGTEAPPRTGTVRRR